MLPGAALRWVTVLLTTAARVVLSTAAPDSITATAVLRSPPVATDRPRPMDTWSPALSALTVSTSFLFSVAFCSSASVVLYRWS